MNISRFDKSSTSGCLPGEQPDITYYDIIGDIHGYADKLEDLLLKLGYKFESGFYQHQDRQAVFVGDFIDRGTQNRRVIEIVRAMVEYGTALAVMGNHEYNAICYHTRKSKTDWLRPHSMSKFRQHQNFLKEYPLGQDDTNEVIDWFKTLPLFIETEDFRLIHACWDEDSIAKAKPYLNENNSLNHEFFVESATNDTELFNIIERLLKGVEVKLPATYSFKDKDGKERFDIRVKWWGETTASYQELAFGYGDVVQTFPDEPPPDSSIIPFYATTNPPIFFGHYWMVGTPDLQQDNVCCVDYSAGKGEKLVCYSLTSSADNLLSGENFCWAGSLR